MALVSARFCIRMALVSAKFGGSRAADLGQQRDSLFLFCAPKGTSQKPGKKKKTFPLHPLIKKKK